jgi:hypothetical protein
MTTEQEEFDATDPARRIRHVRETIRRETARLPKVDADGRPLRPSPTPVTPTGEPAEPIRRLPAPNKAQGSSASGPPDRPGDDVNEAKKAGDWRTVIRLENDKIARGR